MLFEDAEDVFAVRRIVDIGAGEELVDDILHLDVAEHLSLRDGSMSGHARRKPMIDIVFDATSLLAGGSQHVGNKGGDADALDVGGDGVDGIAVGSEVGEFEAHVNELGHHLLQHGRIVGGELQDLGEDHSLGVTLLVLHLEEVFLEEDAVMGATLVDNHQARLDSGHDVTALVLVVDG